LETKVNILIYVKSFFLATAHWAWIGVSLPLHDIF